MAGSHVLCNAAKTFLKSQRPIAVCLKGLKCDNAAVPVCALPGDVGKHKVNLARKLRIGNVYGCCFCKDGEVAG